MRECQCCGHRSAQASCPNCGEASWFFPPAPAVQMVDMSKPAAPTEKPPPITRPTKRSKKSKRSKPGATAGNPGTTEEN